MNTTTTYTLIEETTTTNQFGSKLELQQYLSNQTAAPHPTDAFPGTANKVVALLEDPRFTLRTVSSIVEKTGVAGLEEIIDLLTGNGVEYVIKHKRDTGEELIGLAARN